MSEYEIPWWKDWLEADMLDRLKMVEKLPFTTSVVKLSKSDMDEEMKIDSIASYLNGLFQDLENAMYVKHDKECEDVK